MSEEQQHDHGAEAEAPAAKPAMPPPPSAKAKDPVDIKVTANQNGFYAQDRKAPGAKFTCKTWGELGDWMTIDNPSLEARHQAEIKARVQKLNSAAN